MFVSGHTYIHTYTYILSTRTYIHTYIHHNLARQTSHICSHTSAPSYKHAGKATQHGAVWHETLICRGAFSPLLLSTWHHCVITWIVTDVFVACICDVWCENDDWDSCWALVRLDVSHFWWYGVWWRNADFVPLAVVDADMMNIVYVIVIWCVTCVSVTGTHDQLASSHVWMLLSCVWLWHVRTWKMVETSTRSKSSPRTPRRRAASNRRGWMTC